MAELGFGGSADSIPRTVRISRNGQGKIDPATSQKIAVLRVLCIFFMLSVHVNPALDWGAVGGLWGIIGVFWTDVLGKASVATLSLVSGYLLLGSLSRKQPLELIGDRFIALYLPMVFWNAVFIAGVLLAGVLLDVRSSSLPRLEALTFPQLFWEGLLNAYGTPAVRALGFLRDLLVCSAILLVAVRLLGRHLVAVLPILLLTCLFGSLEPVVNRPNILLFMTAGIVLRQYAVTLALPEGWRAPILVAFALVVAVRFGTEYGLIDLVGASVRLENLVLRVVLTLVFLDIGALVVRSSAAKWLLEWEPHVFLAYLSHTIVISALWMVWNMAGGDAELPGYGVFFIATPLVALATARLASPIVGMLPASTQIAIRGKAARSARRRTAGPIDNAAAGSV